MAIRGNKEAARAIRELAKYVTVPIGASSRFALQPTLKQARSNVTELGLKDSTGALRASLTIKPKRRTSKVNPTYQVGPNAAYQRGERRPVKYAHLIELGTAPHYQPERGVTHPGSPAQPFLEPAYLATRDQVVDRFGKKIGPEIEKRATKLAAKGK
ncbi:HK97 gp10 family phage protein [Mesorhizobium sp.]|uniref:HK97 gp10 family phage protein n=1 Tax=Mesorhizobium sp. TaxID=1871066 RepID=UPI000FE812CC|nr:HK97 gp10 family phage protein [Mesorhizobium sp.]RWB65656.1 MAG: hypothetical protein EOQ49_31370 [Mesorhizobium sp.]